MTNFINTIDNTVAEELPASLSLELVEVAGRTVEALKEREYQIAENVYDMAVSFIDEYTPEEIKAKAIAVGLTFRPEPEPEVEEEPVELTSDQKMDAVHEFVKSFGPRMDALENAARANGINL